MSVKATPTAGSKLITPKDHLLILIDYQSQMAFATRSVDVATLRVSATIVARGAAGFGASTLLTSVAEKSFSGPTFSEVTGAFPGQRVIDRTTMNSWEDTNVIRQVNEVGK